MHDQGGKLDDITVVMAMVEETPVPEPVIEETILPEAGIEAANKDGPPSTPVVDNGAEAKQHTPPADDAQQQEPVKGSDQSNNVRDGA